MAGLFSSEAASDMTRTCPPYQGWTAQLLTAAAYASRAKERLLFLQFPILH